MTLTGGSRRGLCPGELNYRRQHTLPRELGEGDRLERHDETDCEERIPKVSCGPGHGYGTSNMPQTSPPHKDGPPKRRKLRMCGVREFHRREGPSTAREPGCKPFGRIGSRASIATNGGTRGIAAYSLSTRLLSMMFFPGMNGLKRFRTAVPSISIRNDNAEPDGFIAFADTVNSVASTDFP